MNKSSISGLEELIARLRDALEDARKRFAMISNFGDPYEISQEPEEFGGTDDGLDTVCMAYENMQQIARNGLTNADTALMAATKIEKDAQ